MKQWLIVAAALVLLALAPELLMLGHVAEFLRGVLVVPTPAIPAPSGL